VKVFCQCKKNDYVCRQVSDVPTYKFDYLWVCAHCCLPHKLVYEAYLRPCRGCLRDTCLPWEDMCQACFRIESPNEKYQGLVRARNLALRRGTWPLKSGKTLNEISGPVRQRSLAAQGFVGEPSSKFHKGFSKIQDTI
jgi:hypothetical protein